MLSSTLLDSVRIATPETVGGDAASVAAHVEPAGGNVPSVALIGCSESRKALANALTSMYGSVAREFSGYPEMDDLPALLESEFDVIIVELDSNPEYALEVVENICSRSSVTVMVYAEQVSPDMLVRCMRAGAREFLTQPITSSMILEAMVRASVRHSVTRTDKKATGRLMVFVGAKGGSGVTTVASNFAMALAEEPDRKTALIDLNLPFGNAALDLGLTPQYTTTDALRNSKLLDSNYLSKIMTKHSSGLSVLAAPDKLVPAQMTDGAVERLLSVARHDFDCVVVDAGSRFEFISEALFGKPGSTVYLVLQIGVSDLRNANRLITELFKPKNIEVEVILNRVTPDALSMNQERITKALNRPPAWKIPSDYSEVRDAQNTAAPLTMKDSPVSRAIHEMTRSALGLTAAAREKKDKKWFGLF